MIKKIKRYWTTKPQHNVWMYIALLLFFADWFSPLALQAMLFFQIGLLSPEAQIETFAEKTAKIFSEAYTSAFVKVFNAGASMDASYATKVLLANSMGYGMFVLFWTLILLPLHNILRWSIVMFIDYRKKRSTQ